MGGLVPFNIDNLKAALCLVRDAEQRQCAHTIVDSNTVQPQTADELRCLLNVMSKPGLCPDLAVFIDSIVAGFDFSSNSKFNSPATNRYPVFNDPEFRATLDSLMKLLPDSLSSEIHQDSINNTVVLALAANSFFENVNVASFDTVIAKTASSVFSYDLSKQKLARDIYKWISSLDLNSNEIKLLILMNLQSDFQSIIRQVLPLAGDADLPANSPYLDLFSGPGFLHAHLNDLAEPRSQRRFIALDRSERTAKYYQVLLDDWAKLNLADSFKLLNERYEDIERLIPGNSIGTIRMCNPTAYLPDGENFDADKLFHRVNGLLMPGGKVIFSLRPDDKVKVSQTISATILNSEQAPIFAQKGESQNTWFLMGGFLKIASAQGWTARIGTMDDNGNFLENQSGYTASDGRILNTEVVFCKKR